MSVGKRVQEAIDRMQAGDPESALFQICSAIDATAVATYGQRGRSAYKQFLADNSLLVTRVGLGAGVLRMNLALDHPDVPKNEDGLCAIEDIYYHAVRCGLYHSAELPSNLKFHEERSIRAKDGVLFLPGCLVYGLIAAVVLAPVNATEQTSTTSLLNFPLFSVPLNRVWGRRKEMEWLIELLPCLLPPAQESDSEAAAASQSLPRA